MFTIDDLWKIISYLKEPEKFNPGISDLTTTLASEEKIITNTLFEKILDQPTFVSDDYKRIRSMFIDWYSAHKTISTTQKRASDVFHLPNDHLSELFKSFGFPLGLELVPLTSKANFFLDLVNFYKKKGTPETLVDVLDYYGYSDSDLVEYWLQKDQFGNIIFRGESIRQAATGSTILIDTDVSFEKMTLRDPHWFQTKDQIEQLLQHNKINLPSKTPYYSLSSIFLLSKINVSLSILYRIVWDQHQRYLLNLKLPSNILIKTLSVTVPLLHVYVATIYVFDRMFGFNIFTSYIRSYKYNGPITYEDDPPIPTGLSKIVKIYEELIKRPINRLDRDTRLEKLILDWSSDLTTNPFNSIKATWPLLADLNPDLKKLIDSWFDIGDESYLITYLIGTLDNWIRINVDSKSPSLVIIMLGLGFRDELNKIINFFKPYRARIAFMDTAFSIKNPLTESIILDEYLSTRIESSYRDEIRPHNFPYDHCFNAMTTRDPSMGVIENVGGYAGFNTKYKWDMGTFFDYPPLEQMDDDYYEKLYDILASLHTGSICDDVDLRIESSFYDRVGEIVHYSNYDTGTFYDKNALKIWPDEFSYSINQFSLENINIVEESIIAIKSNLEDNFGMEPAIQFDSGYDFDGLHTKSPVRDIIYIEISSLGYVEITSSVNTILTIGKVEELSKKINISSNIFNTPIILGIDEVLSSKIQSKIGFNQTDAIIEIYNNYFDQNNYFDTGPYIPPQQ